MSDVCTVDTAPRIDRGGYRRLLANSRFRRLWVAQFVSGVGDWLVIGILMPLVFRLSDGSSFAVAGILIAKILPALVLSSVTGVLVDRFDRRRVMIAADVTRAVLSLVLVYTNSLAFIYIIVFFMEAASLFFYPARNALIPYLVEDHDVTSANGLAYTTQQASMLIGLTASGAILAGVETVVRYLMAVDFWAVARFAGVFAPALLGSRAGMIINTFTFVFSALTIASIHVSARTVHGGQRFSFSLLGRDVIESFRFLGDHRELRGLLITIAFAILGGGAIVPVSQDYVPTHLYGGIPFIENVDWLSQLLAAPQVFMLVFLALGMVAGALVVPRLEGRIRLQLMFAGSVAAFGVAVLGFASVEQYWIAALFIIVAGACIATVTVAGNSYVVHTTADELRGRVFTALESVIRVSLLASMIVTASISDLIAGYVHDFVERNGLAPQSVMLTGPRITLMISGLIVIAAAVYAFRTLEWRNCEEPPAEDAPQLPLTAEEAPRG